MTLVYQAINNKVIAVCSVDRPISWNKTTLDVSTFIVTSDISYT